jgi:hypothetical protein
MTKYLDGVALPSFRIRNGKPLQTALGPVSLNQTRMSFFGPKNLARYKNGPAQNWCSVKPDPIKILARFDLSPSLMARN